MSGIGIVADDLTGATTVGALIAREGVQATVLFDQTDIAASEFSDNSAMIVSTDSRALDPELAFQRVALATEALKAKGVNLFSKRIDTTLRGGIGYEVEGMLSKLGEDYLAIVVPSMPQSRRVVIEGFSLIDSLLLSRTDVAQDVRTPVRESHVPTLLGQQFTRKIEHVDIRTIMKGKQAIKHDLVEERLDGAKVFVMDAITLDDIDQIAQSVMDLGWKVVCVDPGPFTERMAVRSGAIQPAPIPDRQSCCDGEYRDGTVVVVAGSATTVTHNQIGAVLELPGTVSVAPNVLAMLASDTSVYEDECQHILGEVRALMNTDPAPDVLVFALNTVYQGVRTPVETMESVSGLKGQQVSNQLTLRFGKLARRVLDVVGKDTCAGVYLTGGDVMVNSMRAFGAKGITLVDYVIPQVDQGVIAGGPYEGLPVVCKGGLTGDETTAVDSVNRIFHERKHANVAGIA